MARFNSALSLRPLLWVFLNQKWRCLSSVYVKWISWNASRPPLFTLETFLSNGQMLLDLPKGTRFELRIAEVGDPLIYENGRTLVYLRDCEYISAITRDPTEFDAVPKIQVKFSCQEAEICE